MGRAGEALRLTGGDNQFFQAQEPNIPFAGRRFLRLPCVIVAVAFVLCRAPGGVAAQAISPQQLAASAFPSTVMVITRDSSGQPLALGSGFFIANGVIATNLHVIEGAASGIVKIIGQSGTYPISGTIAIDSVADLALLEVGNLGCGALTGAAAWNLNPAPPPAGVHLPPGFVLDPFPVASNGAEPLCPPSLAISPEKPSVGEPIFAIGNPEGLEGTLSNGIISAVRTVGTGQLLQITAPISPGSSGGPVLNQSGQVVGIAVAKFKEGESLNFAVPVSYLSDLLWTKKAAGATPLSSAASAESSDKSLVAQMGSAPTAGVTGSTFLWSGTVMVGFSDPAEFSFTLQNHLSVSIQNIDVLVIFYGRDGTVVDADEVSYRGVIPPSLAVRVSNEVAESVAALTTSSVPPLNWYYQRTPDTEIKFRVLNFSIGGN